MNNNLKAFLFLWNNKQNGITDKDGIIYFPAQKVVVIANNEERARQMFEKNEDDRKAKRRTQMASGPNGTDEEMLDKIFHKDDLTVQAFELRDELIIY